MSTQTIGHGSKLQLGDGATPTEFFTDVSGVSSVDFGSNKIDTVENTDMGTPGNLRTFIPGLEDPGDVSAKINVKPGNASQDALWAAKGSTKNFKVIYPGGIRTVAFSGLIISIDESLPDDKLPTWTLKIKISGEKTIL